VAEAAGERPGRARAHAGRDPAQRGAWRVAGAAPADRSRARTGSITKSKAWSWRSPRLEKASACSQECSSP